MKLEQQVVSLPLAKRLKELGVKQESLFYWYSKTYSDKYRVLLGGGYDTDMLEVEGWVREYAAFTVAELGEMLPKNRVWYSYTGFLECSWVCMVMLPEMEKEYREHAETEADARALMLIYLLENGLITKDH